MKVKKILNLKFKELFGIFRRKLNNNKEIENELIEKINGLDLLDDNNMYCDFHNFICVKVRNILKILKIFALIMKIGLKEKFKEFSQKKSFKD